MDTPAPKFCSGCGLQLEATAKFCSVCGTPANAEATPAPAEPVAPVQNTPADDLVAAMGTAASTSDSVIPTPVENIPAPVESVPTPVNTIPEPVNSIPTPVNTIPEPVNTIPTPVNTIPTPVNTIPTPTNDTSSSGFGFGAGVSGSTTSSTPISLEKPASNTLPTDFGMNSSAAVAVTPVKKKGGKVGLFIGIGAVAVIGVLGTVFMFNKGPVMNLLLGDSGYASMLERKTFEHVGEMADNPAVSAGIKTASSSLASVLMVENSYSTEEDVSYEEPAVDFSSFIVAMDESVRQAYGTNSVEVTVNNELSLTDSTIELITSGEESEEISKALNAINDTSFKGAVTTSENALGVAFGVTENDLTLDAKVVVNDNGDVYISFPFGSDTALKYSVEQTEGTTEETPVLELESAEISRIIEETYNIYLKYYEEADIVVEKQGELIAAGAGAKGKLITTTLNNEQLDAMFTEIADLYKNDAYFSDKIVTYLNECGNDITIDEYKTEIGDMFDVSFDENDKLIIRTIVNKNNIILAKDIEAIDDEDRVSVAYINGDENAALEIRENDTAMLSATVTKTDETSGKVNAKFSDGESYPFAINIEYTGVEQVEYLGNTMAVGTYTFSFVPPADFTEEMTEEEADIMNALGEAKLTIGTAIDGNIFTESFVLDVPKYGKYSMTAKADPDAAGVSLDAPANCIDLTTLDESEELTDEDIAVLEQISALVGELKAEVDKASESVFAPVISEALDEAIVSINDAKEPKADYTDVSELYDRIYEYDDKLYNIEYTYSDYFTDDISERIEEIDDELSAIENDYFEYSMDMTAAQLDSYNSRLDKVESDITGIESQLKELKKQAEEAKTNMDFDSMDFDTLLDAIIGLENEFYEIDLYYYDDYISTDDELSEIHDKAYDDYDKVYEAYMDVIENMVDGNYSVPLLRKLRKATQTFYDSLNELKAALPDIEA